MSAIEMQDRWLDIDGLKLHGWQAGPEDAPVIFLLHGGGVDNALLSWRLTIPVLAETHRVVAFDWPGYGDSQALDGASTLEVYDRLLLGLMDALGVARAGLMGISMGGAAGLLFALNHPQRVERLALVDAYGLQRKAPFHTLSKWFVDIPALTRWSYAWLRRSRWLTAWTLRSILCRPGSVNDQIVDEVYQVIQKPGIWRAFQTFQQHEMTASGLRSVYIDRVGELRMPVLLIHGGKDSLVPLASAQEAVRINPAIRLEVLEGCGHWPQRDWPQEFNRVAGAFFGEGK